jgi:hypothetical protein
MKKNCVKNGNLPPYLPKKTPPNENSESELLLKKEESHNTRYSQSVGAMNVKWLFGSSKMKQPL